ncbi:MAG: FAD:protein FMN transferase [Eubacteriales bacterium]
MKRFRSKIITISLLATLATAMLFLSACVTKGAEITFSQTRTFALDTLIDIKVYHYSDQALAENVLSDSVTLISTLENTLSSHIEGTEVDLINQAAGSGSVPVSEVTYNVIKNSVEYSQLTGGLFDVTAGPLIALWAISPPDGHVPTDAELAEVLPKIDYKKIVLTDDGRIGLEDKGMSINLGAIAKGTISDQVKTQLVEDGVKSAIINLGGNVLLIGGKPDGSDFSIGVQDPADDFGEYLLSINLQDKAVVSSGDYERYFEANGVRYHHILNPDIGYPADTNIAQITIVADSGEQADGLSTSVLLLGVKDGLKLIKSLENVEAVLITKDNYIYITPGLENTITIYEKQAKGYTFVTDTSILY